MVTRPSFLPVLKAQLRTWIPFGDRDKRQHEFDEVMREFWEKSQVESERIKARIDEQRQSLDDWHRRHPTRLLDVVKAYLSTWIPWGDRAGRKDRFKALDEAFMRESRESVAESKRRIAAIDKRDAAAKAEGSKA